MEKNNTEQASYPEVYPESKPIPYQYELAVVGEECGEVVQLIGKIMRFGLDSYSPLDPHKTSNHQLLHDEVGDILAAVEFATDRGMLDRETLMNRMFAKRKKLHAMAPQTVQPEEKPVVEKARPHPAIPTITVIVLLMIGIMLFGIGRATTSNDAQDRLSNAASDCYERYNDDRCAALANAAGIEVPPPTNTTVVNAPEPTSTRTRSSNKEDDYIR